MRILIVDDEVIIRTGLCTVIDWKELGLELLTAASSAEEALERIPQEKPHIVLTDIRMSGMDGIELSQEIKKILPDTEIIILTGYDDFSYAQQALRGGVTDYLLKTSRPEEIIKATLKAKQNIMDKWESAKQDNMQQAALRSQLLEKALTRGLQDDEEARTQLHQWFRKNGVDAPKGSGSPTARQVLLVSCSGWGEAPFTDLLQGAAENILYELLPCVTLMNKDHILVVTKYEVGLTDKDGLTKALKRVTETLKCAVFAALGTLAADDEGLRESYRAANEIFAYRGLLGSTGLYTLEDIRERSGGRTICTEKEESELAAILMQDNATDLRHWVNQKVRAQLEDTAATPLSVQGYVQSMVIAGHRWLERASAAQQEKPAMRTLPTLEGEGRPEEVFKVLSAIMSIFHQGLDQNKYAYIHKAIAYIRDNLHQPISLQQVAGFVHINPNHFSEVFKRETGCTYLEFVTRERMKLATDIVQSTQMKVSDIARRVGYEDIKYFTGQFKKHTGKTPSEFRAGTKD